MVVPIQKIGDRADYQRQIPSCHLENGRAPKTAQSYTVYAQE
jgi:hypothetical protein